MEMTHRRESKMLSRRRRDGSIQYRALERVSTVEKYWLSGLTLIETAGIGSLPADGSVDNGTDIFLLLLGNWCVVGLESSSSARLGHIQGR